MSTDYVLNSDLYANMMRDGRFGCVRVINRGIPMEGYHQDDPITGAVRLKVIRWGETYIGCCPFCGDSRYRLSVSHMLGVPDAGGAKRRPGGGMEYPDKHWEMWKCYNEECQSDWANRRDMREWLSAPRFGRFKVRPPAVMAVGRPTLDPVEFPGQLVPLADLPADHPAVRYVAGRRFDPGYLSREWGVGYAVSVPMRSRGAMSENRIIVPVFRDRAMVGWQARYPDDLDWKAAGIPKYLTYFPKSMTLYGIDESAGEPVLVLVEGVTDVWRYGRGALSGLGKTLSADQVALLTERSAGRPIVVVPDMDDPGSEASFLKSAAALKAAGCTGRIEPLRLPAGTDPADMDRAELHRRVRAVAAPVA